jgi:hypothetical protein
MRLNVLDHAIGWVPICFGCLCLSCSDAASTEAVSQTDAGIDSSLPQLDASEDVSEDASEDASDSWDESPDVYHEATVDAEAGLARVVLGLRATARASYQNEASESAELEALAQGFSSGAQGFVEERPWATLAPVSSAYSDDALGKLAQRATLYRSNGRELYLRLNVIDGALDGRPTDLGEVGWGSAGLRELSKQLVDKVFEKTGTELGYLSLGSEVDLYLNGHADEAGQIEQFFEELIAYAQAHSDAPPGLIVGVGLSSKGFLQQNPPSWIDSLSASGKAVMLSHHAVNDAGMATSELAVSAEMQAIVDRAKGRPIVLERISYPSSPLIGGSEAAQSKYLSGLFEYVGAHRGAFNFVGIHALHDPSPNDCVYFAAMQGQAESTELYANECSMGLRQRDDSAKAAFGVFLQGASQFLGP